MLEGGDEVTIDSFALWINGVQLNVSGLVAGSTITVTYSGSTAESTFGTPLDAFSLLAVTNRVTPPAQALFDDGAYYFRLQVRSGVLYMDQTITSLGFGGGSIEGTDWDDIINYDLP